MPCFSSTPLSANLMINKLNCLKCLPAEVYKYHRVKVGAHVIYKNSIAVNQLSVLFFHDLSFTIKFCVTSYVMAETANGTKRLNNDTSRIGKGLLEPYVDS